MKTMIVTEEQLINVIVEFFMDRYRLDDVMTEINTGVAIQPNELRDFGRRAQARANATQIIERLGVVSGNQYTESVIPDVLKSEHGS